MSENNSLRIRSIGEELMRELTDGKFRPFVDIVREKQNHEIEDNLALCFRGSRGKDIVSIYKYNTKMWDLSLSKRGPVITVEANYGRFLEKWQEKIKELFDLGFVPKSERLRKKKYKNEKVVTFDEIESDIIKSSGRIIELAYTISDETTENIVKEIVSKSYKILSDMMDDYYMHGQDDDESGDTKRKNYYKSYYFKKDMYSPRQRLHIPLHRETDSA